MVNNFDDGKKEKIQVGIEKTGKRFFINEKSVWNDNSCLKISQCSKK